MTYGRRCKCEEGNRPYIPRNFAAFDDVLNVERPLLFFTSKDSKKYFLLRSKLSHSNSTQIKNILNSVFISSDKNITSKPYRLEHNILAQILFSLEILRGFPQNKKYILSNYFFTNFSIIIKNRFLSNTPTINY
jgi:hypothetical protein